MNNPQEGVIKFQMEYSPDVALPWPLLQELNSWRKILYLTGLIGQKPTRYGGFGYGNISRRHPEKPGAFIISGTQTGGLADLNAAHYALVTTCQPTRNFISAKGPLKPSSEAMTHGTVYSLDDRVQVVMHAHSPAIWQQAAALKLPMTGPDVPYGSPAMAEAVADLFHQTDLPQRRIFGMAGHEDGIVSFGNSFAEAAHILIESLAAAFGYEGESN